MGISYRTLKKMAVIINLSEMLVYIHLCNHVIIDMLLECKHILFFNDKLKSFAINV